MRKLIIILLLAIGGLAVVKALISPPAVTAYRGQEPAMDLREYFTGPLKAWGIIQDWRGRVISRFDATLIGTWDGDTGTLEEDFVYYSDGSTQRREWTLHRQDGTRFTGTAPDIIGEASGQIEGGAARWSYVLEVPVDGKTYRMTMDDWMWRMKDGVVINRSYMKKFGITVAELTIFIQKQDAE